MDNDVINLETGDCRGATLDPTIPDIFKHLIYYVISNHGIEHLSLADLRFHRLNTLTATNNKVTFIPGGIFIHARRLTDIKFSSNNITAIALDAFSELNHLDWLSLEDNPLRHFDGNILLPLHFRIDVFSIPWKNVEY